MSSGQNLWRNGTSLTLMVAIWVILVQQGAGGLIQNDQEAWVVGFAYCMEESASLEAYCIREGLDIAWNKGITKLIVEADCVITVQLILEGNRGIPEFPEGTPCADLLMGWDITSLQADLVGLPVYRA